MAKKKTKKSKLDLDIPAGPCAVCQKRTPKNKLWCSPRCQDFWIRHINGKDGTNMGSDVQRLYKDFEAVSCEKCKKNDTCEGFDYCPNLKSWEKT